MLVDFIRSPGVQRMGVKTEPGKLTDQGSVLEEYDSVADNMLSLPPRNLLTEAGRQGYKSK